MLLPPPISNYLIFSVLLTTLLFASCGGGRDWTRSTLDKYVELETEAQVSRLKLNPGLSVYVDFSDGMNAAYGTPLSQNVLGKVINTFTGADNKVAFFSLAADEITPLELTQTQLYNAIMSGANYDKPRAPIEKTLETIVAKKQAALLITDFEEYNGGVIQQQNYAKSYFTKWLSQGFNITFYKIDYKEKGKPKHLYFTVFDAPGFPLTQKMETALADFKGQGLDRFVLGSPECAYPVATAYRSSTQGGNYHNGAGKDIVTGVLEDGRGEAFIAYDTTDKGSGVPNEFYPLGDHWENILSNIEATKEEGVDKADMFSHLLGQMYVNFTCQDGYLVKGVEARVQDFQAGIDAFADDSEAAAEEGKPAALPKKPYQGPAVNDLLTASLQPAKAAGLPGNGWMELTVDFDNRFSGTVPASMASPQDLLKVDVVISEAVPQLEGIDAFFAWPGNNSLSESVKNTLTDPSVNPQGRTVATYWLKVI